MAAHIGVPASELIELSQIGVNELDPLLAEEIEFWQERFAWDFRPSADLLRRYVHVRSLSGVALRSNNELIGYSYYVCEGKKGLIGDFFLRRAWSTPEAEGALLDGVIASMRRACNIRRIESQLMALKTPIHSLPVPLPEKAARHDRRFMERDLQIPWNTSNVALQRVSFVSWAERYLEEMAQVVAAAYRGHIDSEINDQYRTIAGARQFLTNIIRYPGCGRFSPSASLLAIDNNTGRVCGMCLASDISRTSGHITQLCILPALRGIHLGQQLMCECMNQLRKAGSTIASLTVTCANVEAIRLYQSLGFREKALFPALVWDNMSSR
jgi:ribosomal protein S18 acetylase RimI-like enzyme